MCALPACSVRKLFVVTWAGPHGAQRTRLSLRVFLNRTAQEGEDMLGPCWELSKPGLSRESPATRECFPAFPFNTFSCALVRHSIEVRPNAFEEGPIREDEVFDLVLTSPQFFDLESDPSESRQSHSGYPTLAGWLEGFLFPSMAKAWSKLVPGGHMVCMCMHVSCSPMRSWP
jgi:hypothetical protein